MAYVYRHIRLDKNEPFYIGVGKDNSNHKRAYDFNKFRRNKIWLDIVSKSKIRVDIIADEIDYETALTKEKEFISIYGRRDLNNGTLVNLTDGGIGIINKIYTTEYRAKLSAAAKLRVVTEETKLRLREISRLRKPITHETRMKISIANRGRSISEKQKNDLSVNRTGDKNPMYGVKGSSHKSFKGYVTAFKNGISVGVFDGVNDCAKKLNLSATKISRCLTGKGKSHNGFTFVR